MGALSRGADATQLFKRLQDRQRKGRHHKAASFMYLKIPLFDPAATLDWLMPLARPILNRWALIAWTILLAFAVSEVTPKWKSLWIETWQVLRPDNLIWLLLIYILLKVVHEFGHGLLCRRFGGQVHDMGIIFLVFRPVPYCDATSSWAFDHRLHRAAVALGGIFVELAFASGAAIIWANTAAGTITHELAHNTIFVAGLGTLLFNANPLLRFDGYYVLCDLLDIPNLYRRANQQLSYLVQRWVFGVKQIRPITDRIRESFWLTSYACLAWVYRVFIVIGIIWFVSRAFFHVGALLAVFALVGWVVLPLARFVRFLAASPVLQNVRWRAIGVTTAFVCGIAALTGVIQFDQHIYADAVIKSDQWVQLAADVDGTVEAVLVGDGDTVRAGERILKLTNEPLRFERLKMLARIRKATITHDNARLNSPALQSQAEAEVQALKKRLAILDQQIAALIVRSAADGTIVAPRIRQLKGAFVERGQMLGRIRSGRQTHVLAVIRQADNLIFHGQQRPTAEVRLIGDVHHTVNGIVEKISRAGSDELAHPSMAARAGGAVRTIGEGDQIKAAEPLFDVRIAVDRMNSAQPGQRAKVRFTFDRKPLAQQWWRRVLQVVELW